MKPSGINIDLLGKVPFFDKLNNKQLLQVTKEAEEFSFEKNEIIQNSEETNDYFWILLYGSWKMERFPNKNANAIIYETDKIGTWHGGIDVIDAIAPVKITAKSHSYILRVSKPIMNKWLNEGFPIAHHLLNGIRGGTQLILERISGE